MSSSYLEVNVCADDQTVTVTIASRSSIIAADAIVLAVTWRRLYRQGLLSWQTLMQPHLSLAQLLLRDGPFILFLDMSFLSSHVLISSQARYISCQSLIPSRGPMPPHLPVYPLLCRILLILNLLHLLFTTDTVSADTAASGLGDSSCLLLR